MNRPERVNWQVFDPNEKLYEVGQSYNKRQLELGKRNKIEFINALPNNEIDVLHLASTIEYVDNYVGLLKSLVDQYAPKYIILTRIKGGNIESYVTRQLIGGYSTPCRFCNVVELSESISNFGYEEIINAPDGGYVSEQFSKDIPRDKTIQRGAVLIMKRSA